MAGSLTTIAISFDGTTTKTIQVWDLSGTGAGPFIPVHLITDATGIPFGDANPLMVESPDLAGINSKLPALSSGRMPVAIDQTTLESIRVLLAGVLTNSEKPVQGVIDMPTAATSYTTGRGIEIITTTAGDVILTYANGSTRRRTFNVGFTRLQDAVSQWSLPNGSTFAGTFCNLV